MSRKIDALVAEHIFGVTHAKENMKHSGYGAVPGYSTQIQWAWEVVEKLMPEYTSIAITGDEILEPEFSCELVYGESVVTRCDAKTAPMAICLAALKAKNVEVGE